MPSSPPTPEPIDLFADLSNEEALGALAELIDRAADTPDPAEVEAALACCISMEARALDDEQRATLHYFWANAWANRQAERNVERAAIWEWDHAELRAQVFHLRQALENPAFPALPKMRRCQILTNLGNQLNIAGRFVEALEFWTRALGIAPNFWMAQGNRGVAFIRYAQSLYDGGHHATFLVFAHDDLLQAIQNSATVGAEIHDAALAYFKANLRHLTDQVDIEGLRDTLNLAEYSLGRSKAERAYRQWCLNERLFLNPLNDLGPYAIAAADVFNLPDFTTPISDPPVLAGFFNQMKQEYVSARWHYYEAVTSERVHFSDRDVLLYNTLDYPSYSLAVEKTKAAYRAAYSIFDKTAFFLNTYMKLGMKPRAVSFASVWREKPDGPVRPAFVNAENWPFRGLYWLSQDLFAKDLTEIVEPDSQALKAIREHLEHRYLKVHEFLLPEADPDVFGMFTDTLAYSVKRDDFEVKALRLLKLARAALIYLSLGMHREEQRRASERPDGLVGSMSLQTWDDRWKL